MRKVRLILLSVLLLALAACERDGADITLSLGPYGSETRKVMILYEAGFNSLSSAIKSNIRQLQEGYLPGKDRNDDVVLVFSHLTAGAKDYGNHTSPTLVRLYEQYGEVQADTLKVWPLDTPIANKEMVTEVFNWIREAFPAAGYGAILASHATGWLPEGYFSDPWDRPGTTSWSPRRKTFGQEYSNYVNNTNNDVEEIEIKDLAAAIPYKLDYILFDACLMATVEVVWELRNVASYLAVSPCEIPSAGFNYRTMTEHLLKPAVPDLQGVCEDYFNMYKDDTVYGATITMVDCSRLDPLASVCRELFDRYRSGIRGLAGSKVQVYDRIMGTKNYLAFFDLKDMLREAGATDGDLADLQAAVDEALVYEAHSSRFISIKLDRCCGLAVYLPAYPDYRRDTYHGTQYLDSYYKENLSWNQATMLVE